MVGLRAGMLLGIRKLEARPSVRSSSTITGESAAALEKGEGFCWPTCIPKEGLVYVFPIQRGCQIVTATIPTIKLRPDFNELASKVF